jgi:ParD-like antitoxin of type II bacterial toxin-antitoxin system
MATTSPTRIDDDLYASAKVVGAVMSRSAAQQIAHWARIGRELEAADSVSHRDIARVLAGARSYDDLGVREQALLRAEWAERIAARIADLDLSREFAVEGRSYMELDEDGAIRQVEAAEA